MIEYNLEENKYDPRTESDRPPELYRLDPSADDQTRLPPPLYKLDPSGKSDEGQDPL